MKLYLVRHGETPWNQEGRLQGRSDIALNETGREAARACGRALQEVPFDRIYCSPLKRAAETASLIRGEREISLIPDERLQEMAFGCWEGRCFRKNPEPEMAEAMNRFFHAPETYQPPEDGESFQQVCARTDDFLRWLKGQEKEDAVILIVAHGALLKAMQLHPLHRSLAQFWGGGVQKNCAVTILEERDGVYQLLQDAAQMGVI